MSSTSPVRADSARSALIAAGTLGAIGVALSGVYAVTGVGIPCPWRHVTHTLCPFCGATTMGAALLRLDVSAAWAANPFVFLLLVALTVGAAAWVVELLGGPAVRLPAWLTDQRLWYWVIGTAALAFTVARNLG
ncbi:MAG: DUF2752 domain-containing protein [Propionibacteriaceae bacterium]|nr:DUF2752 domain-containing protein [Propionibacteriaceae bacterium]